uniref:Uncharacterized protein n=1 Tax=Fagus sylvatica TaxID=28930 RepID=A0A2N9G7H2_FAGSY
MPFFTIRFDLSRLAQQQQQHHHRLTVLNRLLHLYAIFNTRTAVTCEGREQLDSGRDGWWRVQVGLEGAEKDHSEAEKDLDWPWSCRARRREDPDQGRTGPMEPKQSPSRLTSMPRRKRPMPNRSHGTKAKSEKGHIAAEEMLDAAEVQYMCFELLSSACGLTKPRNGRDKARGCREDP